VTGYLLNGGIIVGFVGLMAYILIVGNDIHDPPEGPPEGGYEMVPSPNNPFRGRDCQRCGDTIGREEALCDNCQDLGETHQ